MHEKSIIDVHCHTAGIGAGESGCFISPRMKSGWRYPIFLKAFGVTEKDLQHEGDILVLRRISEGLKESRRVAAAVVLALDGVVRDGELDRELTQMYVPNDFVAAGCRRFGNLLFGASVNPYRPDALERLEEAAAQGAVLLKWLPSIQHIDPGDLRLIPFYQRLGSLGLPLLSHTGVEHSFISPRHELSDPERLRLPLRLGVTVIAAHAGSGGRNIGEANYRRFYRLSRQFPNLFADISALTQVNRLGHLQRLLWHWELYGRLLYGTDMPLVNTPLVSSFFYPFKLSPRQMLALYAIENLWDKDVALKEALGVPSEVFSNAGRILRLQGRLSP